MFSFIFKFIYSVLHPTYKHYKDPRKISYYRKCVSKVKTFWIYVLLFCLILVLLGFLGISVIIVMIVTAGIFAWLDDKIEKIENKDQD